eukprot:CAMPEP_0185039814 /NCGR_PEP_ID=MMETSP1103-20130426/37115_1 /TAXON_ID=36769 /ORGANISM="Paraphysomonas bandaiensis, Strain Caron Lab Isolate" /LENGTH=1342 /DNA_ID=CAMNT_0027578857 /DNA_START=175 /DNA_END=4203 /DNA_ORIENTATION=-
MKGDNGLLIMLVGEDAFRMTSTGGAIALPMPSPSHIMQEAERCNYRVAPICNGNAVLVEGPCAVSVICYSSSQDKGRTQPKSFMDVLLHESTNQDISARVSTCSAASPPATVALDSSTPPPRIDNFSLKVASSDGRYSSFPANSRVPKAFENEFFVGVVLLVVRTKPLDPYFRHLFENNKRMYVMQVQGRFKQAVPNPSQVFIGIESVCSMGMMSKSVCRGMLKLLSKGSPGGAKSISHSLGDGKDNSAFVSVPLLTGVDRLCITPAGEDPPPIQFEFPESADHRVKRKSASLIKQFDTTSTYSVTLKGKNIDLCEWSTCGFRMMNPVNLASFIGGNSSLRFVAYSVPNRKGSLKDRDVIESTQVCGGGRRKGLRYFLEVDIAATTNSVGSSYLAYNENSDSESDVDMEGDFDAGNISEELKQEACSSLEVTVDDLPPPQTRNSSTSGSDVCYSVPIGSAPHVPAASSVSGPLRERVRMEWISEDMDYCMAAIEINDHRMGRSRRMAYMVKQGSAGKVVRLRSYMQLASVVPLLMLGDVEHSTTRLAPSELRRRQLALSLKKMLALSASDPKVAAVLGAIFSRPNELDNNFLRKAGAPRNRIPRSTNSLDGSVDGVSLQMNDHSVSSTDAGEKVSVDVSARSVSPVQQMPVQSIYASPHLSSTGSTSSVGVRMEGSVAVCTGRRSWSEEWAVLSSNHFSIPSPHMPKHLRIPNVIPLGQIRSVNVLTEDQKPFSGYEFFTIGTAARVYYFCVRNEYILSQWIDALLMFHNPPSSPAFGVENLVDSSSGAGSGGIMGDHLAEEPEACVVSPGNFAHTQSRALNHRCVSFRGGPNIHTLSSIELSKQLLCRILKICENCGHKRNVSPASSDWVEFSEMAALLQSVTLVGLTKPCLVAFFLNIFHTILLHAFVVLGMPSSGMEWRSFKIAASYEIAGDLMSLRDIDEYILGNLCNKVVFFNMLRVSISHTDAAKQIESRRPRHVDPSLIFPSAGLYMGELLDPGLLQESSGTPISVPTACGDWRVALCTTTGCMGMPNSIIIFDGADLEIQLHMRCREVLMEKVTIDSSPPSLLYNSPSVTLPRSLSNLVPLTPTASEGRGSPVSHGSVSGSTTPVQDNPRTWLPQVMKYLTGEKYEALQGLLDQSIRLYVFFAVEDFSSFRYLTLASDCGALSGDSDLDDESTPVGSAWGRDTIGDSNRNSPVLLDPSECTGGDTNNYVRPVSLRESNKDSSPSVKVRGIAATEDLTSGRSKSVDGAFSSPSVKRSTDTPSPTSMNLRLDLDDTIIDGDDNDDFSGDGRPPRPIKVRIPVEEVRAVLTQGTQDDPKAKKKKKRFTWKSGKSSKS